MNGARHLTVSVAPSHLVSLARCAPSVGIKELIWNALDADATDVRVRLLEQGALHDVGRVEVKDNGTGIDVTRVDQSFSALGWSWKKPAATTPGGRLLHGLSGRGRFQAGGIGSRMALADR